MKRLTKRKVITASIVVLESVLVIADVWTVWRTRKTEW